MEFICTNGDPRSGIERIGCNPGLLVARTDSDVIEVRGSGDSRQNDAHACIAWVGRLEVDVGACGLGVLNFGSELIHGEGPDRWVVIRVIERLIGQRFGQRIIAQSHDLAAFVDEFKDRIERTGGLIDIEPNGRPCNTGESVHVHVLGRGDRAGQGHTETEIFVAEAQVRCKLADVFGLEWIVVAAARGDSIRFLLVRHIDVAIVAKRSEADAAPISGLGQARRSVVVGVSERCTFVIESSTDRIIGQGGNHDRETLGSKDLDGPTDSVLDIQGSARSGDTRVVAGFDDQAGVDFADKSQATERMEIRNDDFALKDVHDVGIVHDRFGQQRTAPDTHPVESISAQAVVEDQRAVVADTQVGFALVQTGGSTEIADRFGRQAGVIDTDRGGIGGRVVSDHVVDDDRLAREDKNGRSVVVPLGISVRSTGVGTSRRVSLDQRIRNTRGCLMHFDCIERSKPARDTRLATGESHHSIVEAQFAHVASEDTRPIAGCPCSCRSVVVGVKGPACPVAIVEPGGKDHRFGFASFGDQSRSDADFDARAEQFSHDPRIDHQRAVLTGTIQFRQTECLDRTVEGDVVIDKGGIVFVQNAGQLVCSGVVDPTIDFSRNVIARCDRDVGQSNRSVRRDDDVSAGAG